MALELVAGGFQSQTRRGVELVVRGDERIPALVGLYVFSDSCGGQIWPLRGAARRWTTELLLHTRLRHLAQARKLDISRCSNSLVTSERSLMVSTPRQ